MFWSTSFCGIYSETCIQPLQCTFHSFALLCTVNVHLVVLHDTSYPEKKTHLQPCMHLYEVRNNTGSTHKWRSFLCTVSIDSGLHCGIWLLVVASYEANALNWMNHHLHWTNHKKFKTMLPDLWGQVVRQTKIRPSYSPSKKKTTLARIHYKTATLAFRHFENSLPPYLSELLHTYQPPKTLQSSREKLLIVPRTNLKFAGNRSYHFQAAKIQNSPPTNVCSSPSFPSFKKNPKTHLFKEHFSLGL